MKEYYNENGSEYSFDDRNHSETLTVVYHSVPQEIKDDFYNNKFDGEVSEFYMKGKDIICGVLSKPVEKTNPSGVVEKGVRIYGIYRNKDRSDDTKLLENYISICVRGAVIKKRAPYRQKYFFVEAVPENDEQRVLLESVGFCKDVNSSDVYYRNLRRMWTQ